MMMTNIHFSFVHIEQLFVLFIVHIIEQNINLDEIINRMII